MELKEVIKNTQKELKDNESKWKSKYEGYFSNSENNLKDILDRRSKFYKRGKLSVYSSIGKAKDNSRFFDLRFQGQSVGNVKVESDGNVLLIISKEHYKKNSSDKYLENYPKDICKEGEYKWKSKVSTEFRKYFESCSDKKKHPEHRFENLILKEFAKNESSKKSLIGIQPVTIGTKSDLFFQMPTPLSASGNSIKYSDGKGGIDILARRKGKLTIIELKDEYNSDGGPDTVIRQAIAYATFITELCKTKAQYKFWKICGFNNIPTGKETLNVAVMLPDPSDNSKPSFAGTTLSVPGSEMKLNLHYILFDKEKVKITRTSFNVHQDT